MVKQLALQTLLRCPMTGNDLSWLDDDELKLLNQRFPQTLPIQSALKVLGHDLFYPVVDDIFYLLPDLVLKGDSEHLPQHGGIHLSKQQVQQFYNEFGWQSSEGVYQDAQDSEDLRSISREYIERCHLRLKDHLPPSGQFLLDVASGPLQYPAYLTYSEHYDYRICADISLRALKEAKKKLGSKGIYLLCDVTQLPIKTDQMDAVVSLHTIYHVPKDEQKQAFAEIHRVLKPQGTSVVVYSWGQYSLLMNLFLLPLKLLVRLKRKILREKTQPLYFYAHPYHWYQTELQPHYQMQLFSWRSVNVPFLKIFIHRVLGGRFILKGIFWLENRFPTFMGRMGAYPIFVSKK